MNRPHRPAASVPPPKGPPRRKDGSDPNDPGGACHAPVAAGPGAGRERAGWVDNLRTTLIVLVVNMHACVTYSHVGSWYRMEGAAPGWAVQVSFIFWQAHLQAFFMGLLFFLAGVFAQRSLVRRGPAGFLRERARRLGLPSVFYMGVIHPFLVFVLLAPGGSGGALRERYGEYLTSGAVLRGSGPLWFALALLAFSAVLAAWRAWRPATASGDRAAGQPPPVPAWVGLGVGLGLVTFLVRLWHPLGTSVWNFQPAYFPQYVAAFALGVLAGRDGWFDALARCRAAGRAGWFGLVGGPVLLAVLVGVGGPPPEAGPDPYVGGWNIRAWALASWEQGVGLALGLGCLAWFRRYGNWNGRPARWLSERAFGVYVLHAPVLVALTPLLRPVAVHPWVGCLALTATGLVGSFLLTEGVRRLPGGRRLLG